MLCDRPQAECCSILLQQACAREPATPHKQRRQVFPQVILCVPSSSHRHLHRRTQGVDGGQVRQNPCFDSTSKTLSNKPGGLLFVETCTWQPANTPSPSSHGLKPKHRCPSPNWFACEVQGKLACSLCASKARQLPFCSYKFGIKSTKPERIPCWAFKSVPHRLPSKAPAVGCWEMPACTTAATPFQKCFKETKDVL